MNIKTLLAASALSAALCAPAAAITFEGAVTFGGTAVTDYSAAGLVSFDIDFANMVPAVLDFRVDNADGPGPISLNAVLRNFTGNGLNGFDFGLNRGSFASVGSVTTPFVVVSSVESTGGFAQIRFSGPEYLDVEIGNALGSTAGAVDWTLGGLVLGDRFSLTVTPVPEPGTWALLLAGLAALGFRLRHRG